MRTTISPGQWHGQLLRPCWASSAWHSRRAEIGLKALYSLPFTAEHVNQITPYLSYKYTIELLLTSITIEKKIALDHTTQYLTLVRLSIENNNRSPSGLKSGSGKVCWFSKTQGKPRHEMNLGTRVPTRAGTKNSILKMADETSIYFLHLRRY